MSAADQSSFPLLNKEFLGNQKACQYSLWINPFSTEPSAVFLLLETDNLGVIH